MLDVVLSNSFKKDLKLAKKRGYNLNLLADTVDILMKEEPLPAKYRDHNLIGNYAGYRECHIQPDWLLIYSVVEQDLVLLLLRTGRHTDLFDL